MVSFGDCVYIYLFFWLRRNDSTTHLETSFLTGTSCAVCGIFPGFGTILVAAANQAVPPDLRQKSLAFQNSQQLHHFSPENPHVGYRLFLAIQDASQGRLEQDLLQWLP